MDIVLARTFLAIVAHGSFLEAARQLHVTQSTASARIRNLERALGTRLFQRDRAGARLTDAGKRFVPHAKTLVLTMEQAFHDVGLPGKFQATIRIGGRIALWDGFLPRWIGWMRETAPDISIRSDIGFESDLMRRLIEGTLDIGLMYTPTHAPGLVVEQLFEDTLILVTSRQDARWPDDDYIYIDWGPGFYATHRECFPELDPTPQVVNIGWLGAQILQTYGGSCFLPKRMVQPLLRDGRLYKVKDKPEFSLPAYVVFPCKPENEILNRALDGLREIAASKKS
ncbi:MAG: LysR family transcriptional regulator [Proteobacteria bacterium]|nr:MAG: LysR family transcriptional regulator [Pseudomonadota bacterium]